jgi:CheY-like chemotaxis protein
MNLLNNAAKYTEVGGRIELKAQRREADVEISVKDSGIGISADQLSKLFQMFYQVQEAQQQSQGGLGIGLALVHRLVEMHGGSVTARSEGPGRGTEFIVRLPVMKLNAADSKPPVNGDGPSPGGRRVLVVDDNRDAATSLSMLLKISGNETIIAHDGPSAVDAAESFRPEVVLLDIGLPRLNGYEVARAIRERPWGRDVLLVALTGWGQEDALRQSQDAGFDHHMVKPVNHAALKQLLNGHHATDGR